MPDEIKEARGTLKPSRTNQNKPRVDPAVVPACPEELTGHHVQVWARLKAAVEKLGVYAETDYESFRTMVQAVVAAQHIHEVEGACTKDVIAYRKQALEYLRDFGLTPVARARVNSLGQAQEDDLLGDFLQ